VVGNQSRRNGDQIIGIKIEDFESRDFKVKGCQEIIDRLKVDKKNIYAIGDSPADLGVFGLAGTCITINAKGGIDEHAKIVLKHGILSELIPILQNK